MKGFNLKHHMPSSKPTPITPTPTDLDKLKDDIAVEVSIVFKHAKLGTDYTINCTNTIASMAENYARALIQAEIVKARIAERSENKWLPDEAKWIEQEADRITALKEGLKK